MEYRKLQACINYNIHIYTCFFLSYWGLFYSILGKARIIACNLLILMSLPLFLCNNNGSICICGQVLLPQQYNTIMNYIKISCITHLFFKPQLYFRYVIKYIPENSNISTFLQVFLSLIVAKEISTYFIIVLMDFDHFLQTFIRLINFIAYYIKNSIYTTKPSKLSIYDMNNFGQEIFSSFQCTFRQRLSLCWFL